MTVQTTVEHDDDVAVQVFANVMCRKLKRSREVKGRNGWQHRDPRELTCELLRHLTKGDPVDVANFAMFIAMQHRKKAANRKAMRAALREFIQDNASADINFDNTTHW